MVDLHNLTSIAQRMPNRDEAPKTGMDTGQGGSRFSGTFRAVEAYDPATDTWMILPSMPQAKHGGGVALIGNRIYLASGSIVPGRGFGPDWVGATGGHDVLELPPTFGASK